MSRTTTFFGSVGTVTVRSAWSVMVTVPSASAAASAAVSSAFASEAAAVVSSAFVSEAAAVVSSAFASEAAAVVSSAFASDAADAAGAAVVAAGAAEPPQPARVERVRAATHTREISFFITSTSFNIQSGHKNGDFIFVDTDFWNEKEAVAELFDIFYKSVYLQD